MAGAIVAVAIVLPAAVLQLLVDVMALRWLLFGAIFIGFGAGGWRAAATSPATPLTSGALAALVAFVVVQGIAVAIRLASGDPVNLPGLAFGAMLATSCGMLGASLRLRRGGTATTPSV